MGSPFRSMCFSRDEMMYWKIVIVLLLLGAVLAAKFDMFGKMGSWNSNMRNASEDRAGESVTGPAPKR